MAVEIRSAKATATRDQILDAAARLIHLRGYHGTSLDDVLRKSGVGKGNFAIIARVVERFLERTLEPAFVDLTADPLDQVRAFLDRLLDVQRQRNCVGGCPMGNLASELSDVHEGFRQRLADIFERWQMMLATTLERGRESGRLRADLDAGRAAGFVVAALEGAILMAKVTKDISVMEKCVAAGGRAQAPPHAVCASLI